MGGREYGRALRMLGAEPWRCAALVLANLALALVHLAEPILFGRVVDALGGGGDALPLIGGWAAIGLVGIVAGVAVCIAADRLAHRRRLAAMGRAFEQAILVPLSYHAERGFGAVVRAILAGSDALFWLWLGMFREQLAAMIGILVLVPTAIAMDGRMAAVLGGLAAVFVVLNVIVAQRTSNGQASLERYYIDVYGRVGDVIGNVSVVQSYSRVASELAAMRGLMQRLLAAQFPILTWWGLFGMLTRSAGTIAMVTIFVLGALLARRGEITVGEIVSFVAFASMLIGRLDQLSGFAVRVYQQAPTLKTFFGLLDEPAAIQETPDARRLEGVRGYLRYESVGFRYGTAGEGVFDIDFEVLPGQTVALVGPTGAGKTTVLALLQRLRPLAEGRIVVDGHDIRTVSAASLRESVAVVFQDAGLFNRSIGENIRIGRPDASDAEVEAAARLAEAHDFIVRKPGGYGFVIGERGTFLSGGERQRIAIARAIVKDAPILILDEATSALDVETEARIKRALDALRRGRTTLVIAHRLSTVANADLILVMEKGRVVERGRFGELARAGGLFARMVAEGGFTEPVAPAAPVPRPSPIPDATAAAAPVPTGGERRATAPAALEPVG